MISLQDEIQKFQKLVYNPQLEEFVTVDQMFTGGGITMESIIQETNFIVQELKKMNAMFKNYCKLNDKIYKKITEHQLSVHSEQARLNALAGSVDRKLEDSLKKIKEIHEDTLNQNQKSRQQLAEQLDPIKKELDLKVDQATFSAMVKKHLEQEGDDEQNEQGNESYAGNFGQAGGSAGEGIGSDGAPLSPYPKKKGKVNYNEFYKFRQQLDAKLKSSDTQLTEAEQIGTESKNLIMKYIPQINNLAAQLNETNTSLYKLQMTQTDNFNSVTNSIKNLSAELNNKLNDQVWKDKFQNFQEKQIKPIVQKLQETLRYHEQTMEKNKEQNIKKFKEVEADILKNKNQVAINKRQIDKLKNDLKSTNHTVQLHEKEFKKDLEKLDQNLELLSQQSKKALSEFASSTQKQITQIQKALASIVQTVQEAVVKVVNKRFDLQLKMIDKSIRQNAEATKQIRIDVTLLEQQTKNVKQILSQKANFSDIVLHVQKKADKEDFRQLQNKLHETSQELISKKMNDSINLSSRLERNQNSSSRKTPTIHKSMNSKTLFMAQKTQRKEIDSSTKLFMCGMEGHVADSRKSWTQSARRRNQKSSTAVVSDFIL